MQLIDLTKRNPAPSPWAEGDNIPWSDPDFSQRMLQEHLTQDHDMASRTTPLIDQQVAWIHDTLLNGQPSHILDLGCGPGLYASRLATLGHRCMGIDYSPASIAYAREHSPASTCTYMQADLREADYGEERFDLAMLLFGETNVFSPYDIGVILSKAAAALKPGGRLLLEPHTADIVQEIGESATNWYTSERGLFSERPHLMLTEHFWEAESHAATIRHFVIDAASAEVKQYAQTLQAYTDTAYIALLESCGFKDVEIWPNLGNIDQYTGQLMAIAAKKN